MIKSHLFTTAHYPNHLVLHMNAAAAQTVYNTIVNTFFCCVFSMTECVYYVCCSHVNIQYAIITILTKAAPLLRKCRQRPFQQKWQKHKARTKNERL